MEKPISNGTQELTCQRELSRWLSRAAAGSCRPRSPEASSAGRWSPLLRRGWGCGRTARRPSGACSWCAACSSWSSSTHPEENRRNSTIIERSCFFNLSILHPDCAYLSLLATQFAQLRFSLPKYAFWPFAGIERYYNARFYRKQVWRSKDRCSRRQRLTHYLRYSSHTNRNLSVNFHLIGHDEGLRRVPIRDVGQDADGLLLHVRHIVALQDQDNGLHYLENGSKDLSLARGLCSEWI